VKQALLSGILRVSVDLPGKYTVALHALDGSLAGERRGRGPASFEFTAPRAGGSAGSMRILRVESRGQSLSRPMMF
jgi:hypothetical protein